MSGRPVARPALLSSLAAPLLLIGGWTVAARLQPGGFDSVTDTISALAGHQATDRWVMTTALIGVGLCHLTTAAALSAPAMPGRAVLAGGGFATLAVAATPITAVGVTPVAHSVAAASAFLALTIWPALGARRRQAPLVAPSVAIPATLALGVALAWFGAEILTESARVGLSERVAAGAQALWPAAVVISTWSWSRVIANVQ